MKIKKIISFFLLLFTVPSLVCCTKTDVPQSDDAAYGDLRAYFLEKADEVEVTETSVIFTDALSHEPKEIKKSPKTTVGLYASLTTLWYEAGGSVSGCIGGNSAQTLYGETVGRDITADDGMTVVSNAANPKKWDIEQIIALRPSLIICSTAMGGHTTIDAPAKAAGIPVIAAEYDDFRDYLKWFKVFCNLTGHPELWDSIAEGVLDEVVSIIGRLPEGEEPSVFAMFADSESLQANTSNTVVGEMLRLMHALNIADMHNASGAERITIGLEAVYAADPDLIIIQCHTDTETAKKTVEDTYGTSEVWNSLRAVREGRVYYLEKTLFHNKPNSRFAEAYSVLADILYNNEENGVN